jgi:hypothetical protein
VRVVLVRVLSLLGVWNAIGFYCLISLSGRQPQCTATRSSRPILPLTVVSCVGRFRPARHTGHSGCRLAYLGTTEQSGRRPALEYIPARSPVRVGECNGAFSFIIVVHGREELISECLLPDDLIGSRVIRSIALVLIRRQNFMPRVARAASDSIARALSEVLDDYARIYFSSCAMSPTQSPRHSAMILH